MKWTLETRKIKSLNERKDNPRKLSRSDADHLQRSIETFGLCEPVVVNRNGNIIGGHQRIRTLRKLGYSEVEVYVPDTTLSETQEKELCVRLNKNSGDWDFDTLANEWEVDDLVSWGFKMEELHLESIPGLEPNDDEDKSSKKCTMTIYFNDETHLQEAENEIATIVSAYQGATYKVKIK